LRAQVFICQCLGAEFRALYDLGLFSAREFHFALQMVNNLSRCIGACERIVQTPVPLNYARHTSRFLTIWCAPRSTALSLSLSLAARWLRAHAARIKSRVARGMARRHG
jgi:predicted membrane chloride channel (bestrophin family)